MLRLAVGGDRGILSGCPVSCWKMGWTRVPVVWARVKGQGARWDGAVHCAMPARPSAAAIAKLLPFMASQGKDTVNRWDGAATLCVPCPVLHCTLLHTSIYLHGPPDHGSRGRNECLACFAGSPVRRRPDNTDMIAVAPARTCRHFMSISPHVGLLAGCPCPLLFFLSLQIKLASSGPGLV